MAHRKVIIEDLSDFEIQWKIDNFESFADVFMNGRFRNGKNLSAFPNGSACFNDISAQNASSFVEIFPQRETHSNHSPLARRQTDFFLLYVEKKNNMREFDMLNDLMIKICL